MNTHGWERTNPMGVVPAIGRCPYCGLEGQPMSIVHQPCPQAPGREQQILDVLDYGRNLAAAEGDH